MDDAAGEAAVDNLVRDSDAARDSVEIVRQRRAGDRVAALARSVIEILDKDGNVLHTAPVV
jgi:hypothetical protein